MILAIDTTAGTTAAVVDKQQVLGFSEFEDRFGHAENIGNAIEQALQQAKVAAADISSVAISRGPASYTGLRVGMAAGIAFATSRSIPLVAVVALDAVATANPVENSEQWMVVSDAKRGEFFSCRYSGVDESGLAIRFSEPEVLKPEQVEKYSDLARVDIKSDAKLIGMYAEKAIEAGVDLSDATALYLRSPDVTPSTKKRVTG